jgi:hypothetical protein
LGEQSNAAGVRERVLEEVAAAGTAPRIVVLDLSQSVDLEASPTVARAVEDVSTQPAR